MLDFDNIDDWAPEFAAALGGHVSGSVEATLLAKAPKFIEDARNLLFTLTDRDAVIDAALNLIRSEGIATYHGSRLTEAEITSIRSSGLIPLKAKDRRHRLRRALSLHPKWFEVADQLDAVTQAHGQGNCAGGREDQVHLTLSRAGLTGDFNHYLTYGSEFDQTVAYSLLGSEGVELLARDGNPRVIQVLVPGALALDAAHTPFSVDDLRAMGKVPNLVDEFLKAWSYRLAHQGFQSRTLMIDCGMVFRSAVPPTWIIASDNFQS
jgi:hypothetical protein